ncbi:ISNCY family transposase, partial [Acinetobacter pseudolwoffii]|nr:ISNCY family transposase [Acinetobacter pseudolwoffii]
VLAHIQQQHEELEKQNKRSRLKKSMPSRKAQKAVIEQRNLNPVLDSCS